MFFTAWGANTQPSLFSSNAWIVSVARQSTHRLSFSRSREWPVAAAWLGFCTALVPRSPNWLQWNLVRVLAHSWGRLAFRCGRVTHYILALAVQRFLVQVGALCSANWLDWLAGWLWLADCCWSFAWLVKLSLYLSLCFCLSARSISLSLVLN
ncbi:hypothetical protein BJ166DRAFT_183570 [Pestalotiopsis sp. NC0098]|nr:hypothetical protein BJ166DRAFT_183570 [Pestalotiopsis sp. NC0098]